MCVEARDAEEERAGPDERGERAVVDEKKLGPEPEPACAAAAEEGR